jgi:uncharacterized protein (DUF58 family)
MPLRLSLPFRQHAPPDVAADEAYALTGDVLARVRGIEIRTRRPAASAIAGEYRSVFRGAGIEFAEAREYVPGDDVRRIDWNITARTGTPWVKEFVEERELTVIVAVDRSASSLVARPRAGRLEAAAELTALLGFAAAQNGDRTGLLCFSDGIDAFVPPRSGTRHVLRLVRDVLADETPAGRHTNLGAAAEYLGRVLKRRSAVFLISDFFDTGFEPELQALARRHDVVALTLIDPLDLELPDLGLVEVQDAEAGGRILIDTSDRVVRERYAHAAAQRAAQRHEALSGAGVDEVEIRLDQDTVLPVQRYFHRRAYRA